MDFYNTLGNKPELPYGEVGPFALSQLHSYVTDNSNADSLIHRSLLEKPAVDFGQEAPRNYEDLDEEIDSIDKLLPDKSKSIKPLIGIITAEIEERIEIKDSILAKIDKDSLYIENYLIHQMEIWNPNRWGTSMNIERRRSTLEVQLIGLQKEKRMEYVSCFRDLVFLKKDLSGVLKEYWAAKSREEMLSEDMLQGSAEDAQGGYTNGS